MCYSLGLIVILILVLSGCRGFGQRQTAGESLVDTQLLAGGPAQAVPVTSPGEPQRGFEQEPEKAQNP